MKTHTHSTDIIHRNSVVNLLTEEILHGRCRYFNLKLWSILSLCAQSFVWYIFFPKRSYSLSSKFFQIQIYKTKIFRISPKGFIRVAHSNVFKLKIKWIYYYRYLTYTLWWLSFLWEFHYAMFDLCYWKYI